MSWVRAGAKPLPPDRKNRDMNQPDPNRFPQARAWLFAFEYFRAGGHDETEASRQAVRFAETKLQAVGLTVRFNGRPLPA